MFARACSSSRIFIRIKPQRAIFTRSFGFYQKDNWRKKFKWSSRDYFGFRKETTTPLFAWSWWIAIKEFLGITNFIDEDPLRDRVRKAIVFRKRRQFNEAVDILHEGIPIAEKRDDPLHLSRVYDELAKTYYEMHELEEAETLLRTLIQRLVNIHRKKDDDPEFIGVSLKLADVLAKKGQIDDAESGFRHCANKQNKVEEHMKSFTISGGAIVQDRHNVEFHGEVYTDPIALLGMCLEQYAHFLIIYRDESRMVEAASYMDEAIRISQHIFGVASFHLMNMLNNFGYSLILRNRFERARDYLAMGIDKIIFISECSSIIPQYFCNYAEALFHCDEKEKALEYAKKALVLSKSESNETQNHVKEYLTGLERDMKGTKQRTGWLW